jgi:hypothetical protein
MKTLREDGALIHIGDDEGPKAVIDVSMVPDLEGRRVVESALAAFHAIEERQSEATRALYATKRKLEAAMRMIDSKIKAIDELFSEQYHTIERYPGLDSPYQMHDDHLGCYCCEISGLPLRDDDETVEYGNGEALACLVEGKDE